MAWVLTGFMGSGKTTAAQQLAQKRGVTALDSDAEIERREGRSIAELFGHDAGGEVAFRELEERVVLELLAGAPPDAVISLGGGSVLSSRVQEALREHLVVLLDIDPTSAWERALQAGGTRPLASDAQAFTELHREREPLYLSLADAILPARVAEVALRALPGLQALELAPAGTQLLWASAASGEYPVLIGSGLLVDELLAAGGAAGGCWPLPRERSRPFCVSDASVAALYRARLGEMAADVTIQPGESHKTLATAQQVWEQLLEAGMRRSDHVVALGGGVVGDLAGFCAATYQRGVPVVQVPTTLVAQVDSAYGGKTGVDLPQGKNYVGAYHQPAGVIVDPATLASLPRAELAAGWVEVLKTALLAGGALWERVSSLAPPAAEPAREPAGAGAKGPVDQDVILACARLKLDVVARDERDSGLRQTLNLGHTIGHAIETATGYGRYLHGEAVGLGLLAALRLSGAPQLRDQLAQLLSAWGLPTRLEGAAAAEVVTATGRDKKRLGGQAVPFVLLRAPGEFEIGVEVPTQDVEAAVVELCA
ncbi:MAG TPA: 3-dehydroquinate synthase [Solirubrobacteraceae bacterium]|jgi:shikimate kinase/3-dehydroquinate synthase